MQHYYSDAALHIRTYVRTYIHTYMDTLVKGTQLFFQVCAQYVYTYLYEGLMILFLWTAASFYVFRKQWDLSFCFQVRCICPRESTDFHVDRRFAKIHHREFRKNWRLCFKKCTDFLRRASIFPEEGGDVLRFTLWKYGGLDSASSGNRMC